MAFGQQSGPPATSRQVKDLLALVVAAGHVDLRDARGPLGLTQRQAAGKFTRDEAEQLITRLEQEAEIGEPARDAGSPLASVRASADRFDRRRAEEQARLATVPTEVLAAELQRRGWAVLEP